MAHPGQQRGGLLRREAAQQLLLQVLLRAGRRSVRGVPVAAALRAPGVSNAPPRTKHELCTGTTLLSN